MVIGVTTMRRAFRDVAGILNGSIPMKLAQRVVETPMGSTIDAIADGGFWVCDRDHNCREVRVLWEADALLRQHEQGFDYPYGTAFHHP